MANRLYTVGDESQNVSKTNTPSTVEVCLSMGRSGTPPSKYRVAVLCYSPYTKTTDPLPWLAENWRLVVSVS